MTKRAHSWLERTISKDYAEIVHDIVMETFRGFPKKLKRSSAMENLSELNQRTSSCCDSAYATSEDDLHNIDLQRSTISADYSLLTKLGSSLTYFREDSPCFDSDDDTLVDGEEFLSKSFYQKRTRETSDGEDDKDSLLYDSHESASIKEPNCPEENSFANSNISLRDASLNFKFSDEDETAAFNEQSNCSLADSSISSRDVSYLLESSSYTKEDNSRALLLEPSNNLIEELNYEETIGKIYFEENRIQQLQNLMSIGKGQSGYVGSIPHIAAASKMLIANLTKDALITSIAKNHFVKHPSYKNGQIVVENIQLDTDYLGKHGNLPPCYYLVVLQHNTIILHTQIIAPDAHGLLEWNDKMFFDDISQDFTIFMSLYKLQVKTNTKNYKWKKLLKNKPPALFQLVGKKEITTSNIHQTSFEFTNNKQLYVDFKLSINTGKNLRKTPMKLSKVIMKNNKATKVICNSMLGQLDGTNLKLFRYNTQEPEEVISLVQCKRCKTELGSMNTLEIDYEKTHSGGKFYLTFETPHEFREWRMAFNGAILVSKKWNL
ncbi:unnamed protein product [Ceutorhynchus assimilis]|uniref:PH domain-containing protein n=1 Tax=Ceutorhynchus assimilis TaxID=467358 RepID=A0A9N9QET7_9CUCU|nr:unnamed protein product [Ceutorhynchus assimilis]